MIKRRYRTSHWRWLSRWKPRYGTKRRQVRKERLLPLEFHLGSLQDARRRKGANRIIQRRYGRMAMTGMLSLPHRWPYQGARRRYHRFWPPDLSNREDMAWRIATLPAKKMPGLLRLWTREFENHAPAASDALWAISQLEQRPDQDRPAVMEALALCRAYLPPVSEAGQTA